MNLNKSAITKGILTALGIVGLITIAVVAPNLIGAFGKVYPDLRQFSKKQIKRSLDNLSRNGLISIKEQDGQTTLELTKNGRKKILKYKLDTLRIKAVKKWDGRWRVVIFDIPEKFKIARNEFSYKLKQIGFKLLQKSVWICPYPCVDEIDFLKEVYRIRPFVRIMLVESIDIQDDLLKKFSLSPRT